MQVKEVLILVLLAGCLNISGKVSSHTYQDTLSVENALSGMLAILKNSPFSSSGFESKTYYSDCGQYLEDYGVEYNFKKSCTVYEQPPLSKSIYGYKFSVPVELNEFQSMLSAVKKFSPIVESSDINGAPVVTYDNRLRYAVAFQCSKNLIIMLSADQSDPSETRDALENSVSKMIAYCDTHRIAMS